VINWFFEIGSKDQTFGPDNPLTEEVAHDSGMEQFKAKWAAAGYPEEYSANTTADNRNEETPLPERIVRGTGVFLREHVVELGLSVYGAGSADTEGSIDAIGGTIGSLDRVSVTLLGNGFAKYTVYNEMGWESGSRIPGTDTSVFKNQDRSKCGPGGTTTQSFIWYEKAPQNTWR
jgi:hypothetical protein